MDVRIDELHEKILRDLAKRNGQPTAASMVRLMIHNAAKEAGIWPADEPKAEQLVTVPTTQ
jgi:hypothetical protein